MSASTATNGAELAPEAEPPTRDEHLAIWRETARDTALLIFKPWLTTEETALYLGCSVDLLLEKGNAWGLEFSTAIGPKSRRYPRTQLDAFLQRNLDARRAQRAGLQLVSAA